MYSDFLEQSRVLGLQERPLPSNPQDVSVLGPFCSPAADQVTNGKPVLGAPRGEASSQVSAGASMPEILASHHVQTVGVNPGSPQCSRRKSALAFLPFASIRASMERKAWYSVFCFVL